MCNFKLKGFLVALMVSTVALFSACNSGGSSGSSTSSTATTAGKLVITPLGTGNTIEDEDGTAYAEISIIPASTLASRLSESVIVTLRISNPAMSFYETVDTEETFVLSPNDDVRYVELHGLKNGSAILTATATGYIESSEDFIIKPAGLFSCQEDISNPEAPNSCACLHENDGSGLIWYADGSQQSSRWQNWMINGESLNAFNTASHCGYSDWHLPTLTSTTLNTPIENTGGDWGTIGSYAIESGGYISGSNFATWLNNDDFNSVATNFYWSTLGDILGYSWGVNMSNGTINSVPVADGGTYGVLLVRSDATIEISKIIITPLLESARIESNGSTYALISRTGSLSNSVTIALQSNSESMSVGVESVTLSAGESSTYVKVNGLKVGNAILRATARRYNESSVGFRIESAPLFSCVADISNSESPTLCGCLNENDGSGLTWYRNGGNKIGTWNNWCSGSGGVASSANCPSAASGTNGESLNAFNTASHCGYSDWHLGTITDPTNPVPYVVNLGGNWGTIGTYATNNGYSMNTNFATWLNANNFSVLAANYWTSLSRDSAISWTMNTTSGVVSYNTRTSSKSTRILVVRESQ